VRILVINPNTTQAMTDAIGEAARTAAAPGTTIEATSPPGGPRSIEGFADETLAAYHVLDTVASTAGQYDGYVIACFGDPGLYAARELADVPVVGIAEAAMHLGSLVAHRWSVVTVIPRVEPMIEEAVARTSLLEKCASIRCLPLSVLEIEEDIERTKRLLLEEARAAITDDGAEAILLGCAGLGPIDKTMQEALGVPVLDGTGCAVKLVESLLGYGITTSKAKAFMAPEPKEVVGCSVAVTSVYDRGMSPA
jgi:allantoin racemase